jgi:hypothetical protein
VVIGLFHKEKLTNIAIKCQHFSKPNAVRGLLIDIYTNPLYDFKFS